MSFQNDHFGVMLHGAPPVPQDLLPATDTEAESRGQLCLLQLPGQASAPSQSAWCSVTNLVAVALAPEPLPSSCSDSGGSGGGGGAGAGAGAGSGSGGVSRILLLEPSNPEDCTALELPAEGGWPAVRARHGVVAFPVKSPAAGGTARKLADSHRLGSRPGTLASPSPSSTVCVWAHIPPTRPYLSLTFPLLLKTPTRPRRPRDGAVLVVAGAAEGAAQRHGGGARGGMDAAGAAERLSPLGSVPH